MRYFLWIIMAFSLTCHAAENNVKSLKEQIKTMTEVLNSNDKGTIKNFVLKYAIHGQLKDKISDAQIDSLVKGFIKSKKGPLQKVLLQIKNTNPAISEDKLKYTFTIDTKKIKGMHKKKIVFIFNKQSQIFGLQN